MKLGTVTDVNISIMSRYDWHQTVSHVVLSVYCKLSQPDVSFIETNRVLLNVDITFNQSKNKFKKTFLLEGVSKTPFLKTVVIIGNCQRPVFSFGVSQHMHEITNL